MTAGAAALFVVASRPGGRVAATARFRPVPHRDRQPHDPAALAVLFTGELYGTAGSVPAARTVASAYRADGLPGLRRLRGEFALVVHDEHGDALHAVRDRFGSRPLYYAVDGDRVIVSSTVAAILDEGVARRWNPGYLADYLHLGPGPAGTFFGGVAQVPPGCALTADGDGVRVRAYWDLDYPAGGGPVRAESLDETLAAFESELADAVRVRCDPAAGSVGFDLSGGLDSASIVALAREHTTPSTFTTAFDRPPFDESAAARRTAEFLGVPNRVRRYEPADLLPRCAASLRIGETVMENAHGLARLTHCEHLREAGVAAVVSGAGSDETLAGLPSFIDDFHAAPAPGAVRDDPRAAPQLRTLREELGFVPRWTALRHAHVGRPIRTLLRREFIDATSGRDAARSLLDGAAGQLGGRHPLLQSQYLFAKTWLSNYVLTAGRIAAAASLQIRLPFLDHRLFDLLRRMAPASYVRYGRTKFPLRAIMTRHLPPDAVNADTRGFLAPPIAAGVLRELLPDSVLAESPFFEPSAVRRFADRAQRRTAGDSLQFDRLAFIVISVCLLGAEFRLSAA